jgi:DNA-binding response OmpR family regulator
MQKRICLVDDTPDLLVNLADFLEMEGFAVWRFGNAAQALDKMRSEVPDLMITDLWMIGMDGLTLVRECRRDIRTCQLPIIIFSARPFRDYEGDARELGVTTLIQKPAELEDILESINRLLLK